MSRNGSLGIAFRGRRSAGGRGKNRDNRAAHKVNTYPAPAHPNVRGFYEFGYFKNFIRHRKFFFREFGQR